jgi:hypothetical protein
MPPAKNSLNEHNHSSVKKFFDDVKTQSAKIAFKRICLNRISNSSQDLQNSFCKSFYVIPGRYELMVCSF